MRYLAERRGPYALLCTDTAAELPGQILQWYLLRWQVEVILIEELRRSPGACETQRQWSEQSHRPYHPRRSLACSDVVTAGCGRDILIEQRGVHGAAHHGVV